MKLPKFSIMEITYLDNHSEYVVVHERSFLGMKSYDSNWRCTKLFGIHSIAIFNELKDCIKFKSSESAVVICDSLEQAQKFIEAFTNQLESYHISTTPIKYRLI